MRFIKPERFDGYATNANIEIPQHYDGRIYQFALGGYRIPASYYRKASMEADQIFFYIIPFEISYYNVPVPDFLLWEYIQNCEGNMYQYNSMTNNFDLVRNNVRNAINCYKHPYNGVVRYMLKFLLTYDWWKLNF